MALVLIMLMMPNLWFMVMNLVRKPNIFDNMNYLLEKYTNNLEALVDERTEQLLEEKKKTGMIHCDPNGTYYPHLFLGNNVQRPFCTKCSLVTLPISSRGGIKWRPNPTRP